MAHFTVMTNSFGSAENALIKEWRTWQYARSLSKRTVEDRVATVVRMAEWCQRQPESLSEADVVQWLAEGGDWSTNTRWTYFTNAYSWFLWLQKRKHRTDHPMIELDRPKRTKGAPHPVSNHDVQRILVVRAHKRTRAMLLLAIFAGLRVHEIAKIKGEDFDLVARTLTVNGKGGFTATLPLHDRLVELAYQMPRRGFWFPGKTRTGHQRRESVSQTIKEAMVRAGVVGSAHWLRHWFGSALLEAGVDVRVVQTLMRHQNLATTEIYTRVSDRRRIEGIELLDPFQLEPLVRITPELHTQVFGDEFDDISAA